MKRLLLPLLCLVAALLTGCSTINSRIEEKSAFFNTLDAQTQERLKRSAIKVGDTQDMVYIAFGQPSRSKETATSQGQNLTWIYNFYQSQYEGSRYAGHQRYTYYDQRAQVWRVYYEPVRVDIYSEHVEEYLRVIFQDGRVSAIEQTKS